MNNLEINFDEIKTFEEFKLAKSKVFSKEGKLFELQCKIRTASVEEKKIIGQQITELKNHYEELFKKVEKRLENEKINELINSEFIDVTKPISQLGSLHPITIVEQRLRE
ncbi:UNVERIFIED_CONTAM: hypothetical protein O8I53_13090 [Campylobacter lari]